MAGAQGAGPSDHPAGATAGSIGLGGSRPSARRGFCRNSGALRRAAPRRFLGRDSQPDPQVMTTTAALQTNPDGCSMAIPEAHMRHRIIVTLALALALAIAAPAQMQQQGGYLDLYIAKVKPEKRADFDAVAKRIADANRRNNGDKWVASEVIYGDWNTLYFSST